MTGPDRTLWRDPLALEMIAAWVGVTVDQLPETMRAHTCPATAAAWGRVADAARQHINPSAPPRNETS